LRGAAPACRYKAVCVDLTDASARAPLLARLGAESSSALIVAEGLLVYLHVEQVATLARELAAAAPFRQWVLDLVSPELLVRMNRNWGAAMARGRAPFRFAPDEGTAFFNPFGWREGGCRNLWDEGRRLRRETRFMWFWRFLSRFAPPERRDAFRAMFRFVLLER
jgi:O-methyltransferase involved in polyketide biosynthesis